MWPCESLIFQVYLSNHNILHRDQIGSILETSRKESQESSVPPFRVSSKFKTCRWVLSLKDRWPKMIVDGIVCGWAKLVVVVFVTVFVFVWSLVAKSWSSFLASFCTKTRYIARQFVLFFFVGPTRVAFVDVVAFTFSFPRDEGYQSLGVVWIYTISKEP